MERTQWETVHAIHDAATHMEGKEDFRRKTIRDTK